jgi:glycosyltransferase involved in cell wall biosynthesis
MKSILYISPGPTFNPHAAAYQSEWEALSQRFSGHIFTTSSRQETIEIGGFCYRAMKSKYRAVDSLRFLVFCLRHALTLRMVGERIALVATYDPLKTGLIGLLVARIHGARFAPQVNGVYTSDAEWLDLSDSLLNRCKRRIYPMVMRFVLKRADGIKLLFKEQLAPFESILDGKIVRAFHCYVATDAFSNLGEKKEVLFAGFPFKRKGVDILIAAFKKLAPKYPDWTLKVLGWYPDPRELYNAIGGHPQIHHHPPVRFDQMPEHIGSCAIVVLPSRSEAMGRVLVEAMAAEKPRIGSDDDLSQRLDTLIGSPELRREMGLAGKARVQREFTRDVYEQNLAGFYDEVLRS